MKKIKLRLASLFQSGAVFQRDIPLPVWGWGTPRTPVRGTFDDCSTVTLCDNLGFFKFYLPPQQAGIGKILTVQDLSSGQQVSIKDIAVGEVYLAAGQSNMAFQLNRDKNWGNGSQVEPDPLLRFFQVPVTKFPNPQPDCGGKWQRAAAESAGDFSAVGYYFGRTLRRELGVPVGIIGAYLGGMGVESFISREALLKTSLASETAFYDLSSCRENIYEETSAEKILPDGNAKIYSVLDKIFPGEPEKNGETSSWHKPDFDDSLWESISLPNNWTAAGYNHAGVFWFRKNIVIPPQWAGCDLTLAIGAADKCDETFFNGEKIGSTGNFRRFETWNTPRVYTIPGTLVKAGNNLIAIRVASAASICLDGGLTGPAEEMFLCCNGERMALTGIWKLKMEHFLGTSGMEFMRLLGPGCAASLHMLFDNIIHPLIPFAMRGVLWYQGEANAICMTGLYQELLTTMIADWRYRWGQKKLDFTLIQLPDFNKACDYDHFSQWAKLREAQRRSADTTADCQLIVTLKYGDEYDLHPANKFPPGNTAGFAAAAKISGKSDFRTPVLQNFSIQGKYAVATFDTALTTPPGTEPNTLMLAGKDGIFHPATGKISGNTLAACSAAVPTPVKIRYAWSDNPAQANIYGTNGLMLSPFEAE